MIVRDVTRINGIGEAFKVNALFMQFANQIDQLLDATTKTIQFPDNQGIA
jgi:hypothetical protein